MDQLQLLSSVTEDERRTIEQDGIGSSPGPPPFTPTPIDRFPLPMGVIEKCTVADQKRMLMRLYPECQFLCSFAHGDTEATLFRMVSDGRSPLQNALPTAQSKEFYQRNILETPIIYSAVAAVQAATEVAVYPAHLELLGAVTKAWAALTRHSLLALPIWEISAQLSGNATTPPRAGYRPTLTRKKPLFTFTPSCHQQAHKQKPVLSRKPMLEARVALATAEEGADHDNTVITGGCLRIPAADRRRQHFVLTDPPYILCMRLQPRTGSADHQTCKLPKPQQTNHLPHPPKPSAWPHASS